MHNEISDYLRMIDDADNAHSPTSRAVYADALILAIRDYFTDDELIELVQAKADGRLVMLPCKVGDTVYEANKNRNIVSTYRVTHITIMTGSINYGWELLEGIYSNPNGFNEYALGKTVFLTEMEAKEVLKCQK